MSEGNNVHWVMELSRSSGRVAMDGNAALEGDWWVLAWCSCWVIEGFRLVQVGTLGWVVSLVTGKYFATINS